MKGDVKKGRKKVAVGMSVAQHPLAQIFRKNPESRDLTYGIVMGDVGAL